MVFEEIAFALANALRRPLSLRIRLVTRPARFPERVEIPRAVERIRAVDKDVVLNITTGAGGRFWVYRLPMRQQDRVEGYVFVATNITALRRAEEVLRGTPAVKRIAEFVELMDDLREAARKIARHFEPGAGRAPQAAAPS